MRDILKLIEKANSYSIDIEIIHDADKQQTEVTCIDTILNNKDRQIFSDLMIEKDRSNILLEYCIDDCINIYLNARKEFFSLDKYFMTEQRKDAFINAIDYINSTY